MHATPLTIRPATAADTAELSDLFCVSMNYWYRAHGKPEIFPAGPGGVHPFFATYDLLDPGACVVAEHQVTRRLMGASFYHPRQTHVSLGMLAVHPNYFSAGVGSALVRHITGLADARGVPTRLVSSAHNLDSFSLYTRKGFVPRMTFQDVLVSAPATGDLATPGFENRAVRPATSADVPAIAELERTLTGVYRPEDWGHFVENRLGWWSVSVVEGPGGLSGPGELAGAVASVRVGGMFFVGPGVAVDRHSAAAGVRDQLLQRRGETALLLLPVDQPELVRLAYDWGARNIEIHVLQVRGSYTPVNGVALPTFLPESF